MNLEKNIRILFLLSVMVLVIGISGCNVSKMLNESLLAGDHVEGPEFDLDEKEIESIIISNQKMEKKYDIVSEISDIGEEVKNPFEPFYLSSGDEEAKTENTLVLMSIYAREGIEYCEIKINETTYLLKEGDMFSKIYLVQSINENSVVLLKGDEILNLFINEIIYDQE